MNNATQAPNQAASGTELDLDKLEALARAATPGPWMSYTVYACNGAPGGKDVAADDGEPLISDEAHPCDADADFIAAANPATMLQLIELARRASTQPVAVDGQAPDRELVLLKAVHELLNKQREAGYVINVLEETVFYDDAYCDGLCLLDDIEIVLEEATQHPSAAPSVQATDPRNWTEDYAGGENQYECKCSTCGHPFFGHKRRVTCKECADDHAGGRAAELPILRRRCAHRRQREYRAPDRHPRR